ncbi:HpcH/HpaI aldolase/citrate lyase family protein [Acidocella aromatica]|uniref:Citrate lyase subunit beta/citryl-CoA lyase n=1 Tax=Acidocella aromatica TaxID=1303579 RepID=A0A840VSZ2_9PROT|nr:CoA ester lyase [Acidocella aromatica]MBB5373342.1 citrate lyase subunit beta/citryl-CoA lyase [Acidocella aromatica]
MSARSWLFVPADAPAKIAKAMGSGADALILDLEDSVALSAKEKARKIAAETLAGPSGGPALWVRINPLASGLALADLAAVMQAAPAGIVLPKPDAASDVVTLAHYLDAFEAAAGLSAGQTRILPIATETPASVFTLGSYTQAGPRLAGLTWGAEDLPAAIGATASRNPDGSLNDLCRMVRSFCLAGAASAGVPAIDTVYPDFRNEAGLRAWAEAGRREGFTGMMAIHPAQVPVINAVMTPSAVELAHARAVVALFDADPAAGVVALDGKMLDLPHLKQARKILAMAREECAPS